ncbi:hypothetical protein SASPL_149134 [Salvia splendens]|uniref:Protein kinase domain-containing protein n=1 Tax=Salvia splendens TaxID=180675 RepID=A0A8X8WAB9_SALSN|nr:hypothetical protein SASPL_149134 [Salvia splendens]
MEIFSPSFQQCILIILLYSLAEITGALSPDGQALVNFRTAIVSSDGVLQQWRPEDEDPCRWKGVKCDFKSKRVTALSLPNHRLSGPISPDLGKLESLQFLTLHDNNLYGAIPPELGNCTQLQSVFLQGNYLSGFIPGELETLSQLQNLDLSSNSLSGSIPASLGKLGKLSSFNVSTNFLVGMVPYEGVLANFRNDSFLGNRELCGKQIQACKNSGSGSSGSSQPSGSGKMFCMVDISLVNPIPKAMFANLHMALFFVVFLALLQAKKNSGRLLISALATVGALLLVALMCFWGCYLYKRLGKNEGKGLAVDVSGGASIVIFHGDLPYSSKDIIKKLENLNEEHVIGAGGFGTVYKLAMDDGNIFALKRIVKVNEGFDRFFERELEILGSIKHKYLVNLRGYCNSPTSKLLIYDFLSGGSLDEALHEYMQSGRATEKTDVYSFGVLVLEIVSGKRPTDASFIEKGLNIVGWLNFLVSEQRQREIVDPHCEGVQTESLDAILSIAIQCVSSLPEDRPTIHRVVQVLESEVTTPCPSDFYNSD